MKRWIVLLGRGGTVLLAIGLALLLVSLIPAAQTSRSESMFTINRRMWGSWDSVLTPQQSLRFSVTANGTLNVYLFEVSYQTIYMWINEHHPDPIDSVSNVTYLEEFLAANPNSIVWQNEIHNGKTEYEYVPTKITNTTLAYSNPSSDSISIEYVASITTLMAPRKVRTLAQWTIPLGFVLALPWLIDLWRGKTRRHTSQLLTRP